MGRKKKQFKTNSSKLTKITDTTRIHECASDGIRMEDVTWLIANSSTAVSDVGRPHTWRLSAPENRILPHQHLTPQTNHLQRPIFVPLWGDDNTTQYSEISHSHIHHSPTNSCCTSTKKSNNTIINSLELDTDNIEFNPKLTSYTIYNHSHQSMTIKLALSLLLYGWLTAVEQLHRDQPWSSTTTCSKNHHTTPRLPVRGPVSKSPR